MQVLLLPEWFQQAVELQPIKENENEKENWPDTKTPNPVGQRDPTGQTDSNEKDSTLSEQIMQANQKKNLYASICAYLEDLKAHAKSENVKLKDCKVSKNLLIRENQL